MVGRSDLEMTFSCYSNDPVCKLEARKSIRHYPWFMSGRKSVRVRVREGVELGLGKGLEANRWV